MLSAVAVQVGRSLPDLGVDHKAVQALCRRSPVAPVDQDQPPNWVVVHHDASDLAGVVHVGLHSRLAHSGEHVFQSDAVQRGDFDLHPSMIAAERVVLRADASRCNLE